MDTRQLQSFLMVSKYKNFSKAAESLYIGQPALSRQIAELEKQLGAQLFVRSSRQVELTAAGRMLQAEAESIIRQLNQLEQTMQEAEEGRRGHVRLASIGHVSEEYNNVWLRVHEKMGGCRFDLSWFEQEELKDALLTGEIDCALIPGFAIPPSEETIDTTKVGELRYGLILPAEHPLGGNQELSAEDLKEERLHVLDCSMLPSIARFLLRQDTRSGSERLVRLRSINSILLCVKAGMGAGVIPLMDLRHFGIDGITMHSLRGVPNSEDLVLAWHKNTPNPAVKRFVDAYLYEIYNARLNASR